MHLCKFEPMENIQAKAIIVESFVLISHCLIRGLRMENVMPQKASSFKCITHYVFRCILLFGKPPYETLVWNIPNPVKKWLIAPDTLVSPAAQNFITECCGSAYLCEQVSLIFSCKYDLVTFMQYACELCINAVRNQLRKGVKLYRWHSFQLILCSG